MAAAGEEASGGGDKYRSFMYGEGEKDTVWRLGSPQTTTSSTSSSRKREPRNGQRGLWRRRSRDC
ncbi:hypothetical protein EE612_001452 [Oryza sativa]|nr:hypothetical protein EE612_001452 [Oryza sativa]